MYDATRTDSAVSTCIDEFLAAWIDFSEALFFCGLACIIAAWLGLMRLWAGKIAWGLSSIFRGLICNKYFALDTLGFFFLPRSSRPGTHH
ncbi:MAG: hypothetical protein ACYS4W_01720 [Planctomycetota bacterium]|jgi:hypothetical protein